MIFVLGGQGRLGQVINASYQDENALLVGRHIYQEWWQSNSLESIYRYFTQWATATSSIVFIAAGILDPSASMEDHLRVNYLLPKNVIEVASKIGLRVVTFGTVLEHLIAKKNSYVESKALLGKYVSEISSKTSLVTHLRIHTLYGVGQPSSFMFLGQILNAIVNQTTFKMTLGNQLREYHHIQDDVQAIRILIEKNISGVFDLNHGEPISLKELACFIFEAFNCQSLLKVGALPEPREENYDVIFSRSELLSRGEFRETLPAVLKYLIQCSPKLERIF